MAIVRAFPQFSGGNILRNEMLLSLSGYAELGDLMFEEYGNGILRGCKLTTTKEAIQVGRGVVVYEGKLLMIKEPLLIAYYPTDTLCACKFIFQTERMVNNVLYQEVEATITEDINSKGNEIELCRFKLQPGAILRYDYADFSDRATEYDTVNTNGSPFSVMGGCTLSPDIVRAYVFELMECGTKDIIDQMFCMHVLETEKAMSLEAISAYILMRTGVKRKDLTNSMCFEELQKILKSVQQGIDPRNTAVKHSRWSIDVS